MDPIAFRILLEFEAEEESVSGRMIRLEPWELASASVVDRATHEFSGWLGLLNALETLVAGPEPPDDG